MRASDGTDSRPHPTLVLVHGSGHTSAVWRDVQQALHHRSVAVDLPGRADRVASIADVSIDAAAASLTADVERATDGPLVLVGHSAGGVVLPALAARLGPRVGHLVFVAGLSAPHGERVIETIRPDAADLVAERLSAMRVEHSRSMLDPAPTPADGVHALDPKTAAGIDSLNYMTQEVSWADVPDELPRTFVRCLRDRIQPREMQAALARNCGASEIVDLESGHTPAVAVPDELAAVLDRIATQSPEPASRAIIDG